MPELEEQYGIKRICQNCAARYYDLNNEPPVCPSCGTEYDPEAVMRSRRGRVAAAAVATTKEDAAPEVELADAPKSASEDDEEEDEVKAVALDEVDENTLEDGDTDLVVNEDGEVSLDDEFGDEEDETKVDDDSLLDDDDELVDGALPVEGLETGLDEDS